MDTCHAMGGHGSLLIVMVWVWVQIQRKMLCSGVLGQWPLDNFSWALTIISWSRLLARV
jgi:hypothetical protein